MKLEIKFEIKQYNPFWSNQECNTVMPDGARFTFSYKEKNCHIKIDCTTEDRAMQLLYTIWELLCLYDGYFYKPIQFFIDEQEKCVQELFKLNKYITAKEWISSATLLGRNERDLSQKIVEKYPTLSRGIYKKGGPGVNGIYNQDFSSYTILIEIGGYENTTVEVLNSLLVFSECFMEVINE